MTGLGAHLDLPEFSAARGGLGLSWTPPTEAEIAAQEAMEALIAQYVGNVMRAQHDALDRVCLDALRDGHDVAVHRHWNATRFIGLGTVERRSGRAFPTIYETTSPDTWPWDIDDEDDR